MRCRRARCFRHRPQRVKLTCYHGECCLLSGLEDELVPFRRREFVKNGAAHDRLAWTKPRGDVNRCDFRRVRYNAARALHDECEMVGTHGIFARGIVCDRERDYIT